ncbi:hypothetical protein C9J22_13265 [Photobacterium phosphoreum]|uniref:beta family protein n=1 Tax=Photobacterium phosphoreum TaxID=659 RepID=UPI000D17C345|nr:beta family protein [Photobacterium phosphoreum]PSU69842.1 hypothetical protein C9J22_13265 [Photobacterium phosphoreum]
MNIKYYPVLKTSISELRALKKIKSDDFNHVIPIFELTKSRKSKNNQGCDVYKKVDELIDIMNSKPFILDLTGEESLTNEQIESFFDDSNSFYNWTEFVRRIVEEKSANVIPTILAYEDSEKSTLQQQAERLNKYCNTLCIRLSVDLVCDEITQILIELASELDDVIVVIDLGLIRQDEYKLKLNDAKDLLEDILANDDSLVIICVASSFPSSVVQEVPKKEKMSSEIHMYSRDVYEELKKIDSELIYGDYACIHPFRGESRPMVWIPRVDFPYKNKLAFERCSRDDGGYQECARKMRLSKEYENNYIDCWGVNEINSSAVGIVNGKSPSYWISVRSNIHMSRMIKLLIDDNSNLQESVSNF